MQFEKDTERLEEETAQHCEAQKEVFTQLQAAIANTRAHTGCGEGAGPGARGHQRRVARRDDGGGPCSQIGETVTGDFLEQPRRPHHARPTWTEPCRGGRRPVLPRRADEPACSGWQVHGAGYQHGDSQQRAETLTPHCREIRT